MIQDRFWILLGKYLNKEASQIEEEELFSMVDAEEDLPFLIEFFKADWKRKKVERTDEEQKKLNNRWNHLSKRLFEEENLTQVKEESTEKKRGSRFIWYAVAAVVIFLIGFFLYDNYQESSFTLKRHDIVVHNGEKKQVVLPDNTTVWVNAGSVLTYNDGFGVKNRDIWLEGEGYFDVAKDASLPFIVHTSSVTVKVLGTTFNIKAYDNESKAQTTLLSGKVQVVLSHKKEEKIMLSPREKLTVKLSNIDQEASVDSVLLSRTKGKAIKPVAPRQNELKYQVLKLPVNPIDSTFYTETAWINNKIAFSNETFSEIAKKMNRKYDVDIVFKDKKLKNVVMSGVFEKETIKEALQVLQLLTRFDYKITTDSIYLYNP